MRQHISPRQIRQRTRENPQGKHRQLHAQRRIHHLIHQPRQENQQQRGPGPDRVAHQRQPVVTPGVMFLQTEVETPRQRRQQDQQTMGIDAAEAMIPGHHNHHADQPQYHAAPTPEAHPILEYETRQQRAEQRRRLRQHTRRAGADALLAEIDRHVMQAHRKEAQPEQQRQIPQFRQVNTPPYRDHGHEHRSDQKSQQRQVHRIVGQQSDVDAGRGVTPAGHDKRHGQDDFQGGGREWIHGRAPVGYAPSIGILIVRHN
ncbi:hypothetical protein D3C87_1053370 [compost metagenome]